MPTDAPREHLSETGTVYVTMAATAAQAAV